MSKLKELIAELCPDGVEYRKLGEVCKILRGKRLTTRDLSEDGDYPVFHGGIDPIGFYFDYNRESESTMVINVGASAGTVGYSRNKFWSSDGCFCFSHNEIVSQRYLYYSLQTIENTLKSKVRKAGIPTLDNKEIAKIEIPVPPREVQEEVVRILDAFSQYAAELQAELQARKEQYEYYRNELLTFTPPSTEVNTQVKWLKMSEVASFLYGYTDKARDEGDVRFIRITDILDNGTLNPLDAKFVSLNAENGKYLLKEGDLLMARTGATYGKTLYVPNDSPSVFASFLIKILLNNDLILNRYYWHFSKSKYYWRQADKLVSKGGQQQFNANAISQVIVPIPPLAEQERIVSILDKFETLVNDLSEGLPAEIEAVQQRYEYWRDRLLSFRKRLVQ